MKFKCPRCEYKGEAVDGKCPICDLPIEPTVSKPINKYFTIGNIAIAIGVIFIIIGITLGKLSIFSDIGAVGFCIILFGLLYKIIKSSYKKQEKNQAKETEKIREDFKSSKQEEESEKAGKSDNVRLIYVAKSYSTAVLLWLFLGGFGAHKFYLEKLPQGFGYIAMLGISIVFKPMIMLLALCWVLDICTMREQVNAFNNQFESK